jgi:hypothetical protein
MTSSTSIILITSIDSKVQKTEVQLPEFIIIPYGHLALETQRLEMSKYGVSRRAVPPIFGHAEAGFSTMAG